MAYTPKNKAKLRDDALDYPGGGRAGGRGPATVPGTSGSDDRESQPAGAEFNSVATSESVNGNRNQQNGPDFSLMGNENSPRNNPTMGRRSYSAETPTL